MVVVYALDSEYWSCQIEGEPESEVHGRPLASTLAATLGYDVADDEWPEWIDRWAEQIEQINL